MKPSKHILMMVLIAVMTMSVGGGVFVWPAVAERGHVEDEILSLHEKMRGFTGQTTELEVLADEVASLRELVRTELKEIPPRADVAQLIRRLSLVVDGVTVLDQTFTAGQPETAVQREGNTAQAMPVTVDMKGTFDSVFAMLRNAESARRLLRVNVVQLEHEVDPEKETIPGMPTIEATIGLEAIFQPGAQEGG